LAAEGYCCSCGGRAYGKDLAQRRAVTVKSFLVAQGAVRAEDVRVIAYGEDDPVVDTDDEDLEAEAREHSDSHIADRRVVIREWRGQHTTSVPGGAASAAQGRAVAKVSSWYRHAGEGGAFHRLADGLVLHSGDGIAISALVYRECWVYVFRNGPGGEQTCLFPNPEFCSGKADKNPLEPEREHWWPRSGEGFRPDQTPGEEQTIAFVSAGTDPRLGDLRQKLAHGAAVVPAEGTSPQTPGPKRRTKTR
jgi:hypothetical protein